MRRKFIAGNWKMYKEKSQVAEFMDEILEICRENEEKFSETHVGICPPNIYLDYVADRLKGTKIQVFAQNCYFETEGAFTGEISPEMLKSIGCFGSIVGHSERRQIFGETDELVNRKVKALLRTDLLAIVCVGESLEEREVGRAKDVVATQIEKSLKDLKADDFEQVVVAYEPIWAIGTGKTATPDEAQEMCKYIRDVVADRFGNDAGEKLLIQYGGSVKPQNSAEILSHGDIDGALVGGASLKAGSFFDIING